MYSIETTVCLVQRCEEPDQELRNIIYHNYNALLKQYHLIRLSTSEQVSNVACFLSYIRPAYSFAT